MGAFDQFKDQADEYADKARGAMGKRDKARNPQEQEPMERSGRRDGQQRGSESDQDQNRRMDRESDSEQDWA